ncbi:MAG: hypothetical protein EAX96_08245 [Candidatus Lokiarchaeota archaeon]|nr:hypothetical protein [Candidatus Lokiarchaeota archaeon]
MSIIEKYLEKFISSIDFLFKQIQSSGLSETLEKIPVEIFDLNFHFNIKVINGEIKEEFNLSITQEISKLSKNHPTVVGFSIIGTEKIWLEVFEGNKSLMAEIIEGKLKISNIRANWLKITLLSNLLANLISIKLLKI